MYPCKTISATSALLLASAAMTQRADATFTVAATYKQDCSGCNIAACASASCIAPYSLIKHAPKLCMPVPGKGIFVHQGALGLNPNDLSAVTAQRLDAGVHPDAINAELLQKHQNAPYDYSHYKLWGVCSTKYGVCSGHNPRPNEQCIKALAQAPPGGCLEQLGGRCFVPCEEGTSLSYTPFFNRVEFSTDGDALVMFLGGMNAEDMHTLAFHAFYNTQGSLGDRVVEGIKASIAGGRGDTRCRVDPARGQLSADSGMVYVKGSGAGGCTDDVTIDAASTPSSYTYYADAVEEIYELWKNHASRSVSDQPLCEHLNSGFRPTAAPGVKPVGPSVPCADGPSGLSTFCDDTCVGRPAGTSKVQTIDVYCDGQGNALIQNSVADCAQYAATCSAERGNCDAITPLECGYMNERAVRTLSMHATGVKLFDGAKIAENTDGTAVAALLDKQSWHGVTFTATQGSWCWSSSCPTDASRWPDVFKSCKAGCTHWVTGQHHSSTDGTSPHSSTWLIMKPPIVSCTFA